MGRPPSRLFLKINLRFFIKASFGKITFFGLNIKQNKCFFFTPRFQFLCHKYLLKGIYIHVT